MNEEVRKITEKVKSSLARWKRLVLLVLSIYVITIIGRFVYRIITLMEK
jgi:hypothetical protein